jgi:hypothetical protein
MRFESGNYVAQRLPVGRADETLCREYTAVKINHVHHTVMTIDRVGEYPHRR